MNCVLPTFQPSEFSMPSVESKFRPMCDSEQGFWNVGSHSGAPLSLQTQGSLVAADPMPSTPCPAPNAPGLMPFFGRIVQDRGRIAEEREKAMLSS